MQHQVKKMQTGAILTDGNYTLKKEGRSYMLTGINDKGQPVQRSYSNGKVAARVFNTLMGK